MSDLPNQTIAGTVTEVTQDKKGKPKFKVEGADGKSRTIRASNYDGPLPALGDGVFMEFRQWKPEDGKYTMNFLEIWEPRTDLNGAQNGSQGSSGGRGGFNEDYTAARWALSTAAELKVAGFKVDDEVIGIAAQLLSAARELAQPPKAPKDPESSQEPSQEVKDAF